MKKILLSVLFGIGVLASQPTMAQVSASSRITSTESNLMLHVREARSDSGLAPAVQAKVGPVSYSSKEGFGLNVATVDVCADSLTGELALTLPSECSYSPFISYPSLPSSITIEQAQNQLNAYFANSKNAMAAYLRVLIKQNKAASAWYTFESPLTVTYYTTTSTTDSEGNVTYETTSRQEERKVTWFLFADENGAAVAGNPKISDSTPEILEVIFFPSNSQRFLDEEEIELPLGQIKWRKINSTTGAPLSAFVTENVGAAYDMPVNEMGAVQEGLSTQPYVSCLVKNDGCSNNSAIDVSDLMSREGASAAVVRYLTPAVIATFPINSTPNADGTFDYREKVSLNVSSRVFDYQFSCVNPKYTNTGSYNVEMNSAMHTYTVNQSGDFNPLSSSPFSFQAYLSNKTYTYETTYPAAQQGSLAGLIIDPLRSPQLASTTFYPGSIVAALEVRNKAEFCERPCGAGTVNWRHLGQATGQLCTATAPLVDHLGTRTVLATAENFSGSAQYRCDNGTLSQVNVSNAQCVFTEPKKDCQAGSVFSWSVGSAQCTGANSSIVSHGGTTTITDAIDGTSSTDGTGTARYSCDDGTLTVVANSQACSLPAPPPSGTGGGGETPPPVTPEPPVVQPPVIPPIAIPDGDAPDGAFKEMYEIPSPPNSTFWYTHTSDNGVVFTATMLTSFTPYKLVLFAYRFDGVEYREAARVEITDCVQAGGPGCGVPGVLAKNGTVVLYTTNADNGAIPKTGRGWIYSFDKTTNKFTKVSADIYGPSAYSYLAGMRLTDTHAYLSHATGGQLGFTTTSKTLIYRKQGSTWSLAADIVGVPSVGDLEESEYGIKTSRESFGTPGTISQSTRYVPTSESFSNPLKPSQISQDRSSTFVRGQPVTLMDGTTMNIWQNNFGFNPVGESTRAFSPSGRYAVWMTDQIAYTGTTSAPDKQNFVRVFSSTGGFLSPIFDLVASSQTKIDSVGFTPANELVVVQTSNAPPPLGAFNIPKRLVTVKKYGLSGVGSLTLLSSKSYDANPIQMPLFGNTITANIKQNKIVFSNLGSLFVIR